LGVPKLQSNTPTLGARPCSNFSVPCRVAMLTDQTISCIQIYLRTLSILIVLLHGCAYYHFLLFIMPMLR
jgi:hypothetical protein